ncbi:MAG: hypothetical protein MRZ61_04475 [Oscillospiraceae bacterium]|nr:hypothetical protein [Oscillospiraceae bacterium]
MYVFEAVSKSTASSIAITGRMKFILCISSSMAAGVRTVETVNFAPAAISLLSYTLL